MTSENFYFSNKKSKNIFNIAVKGTFDDCQNIVKKCLMTKNLESNNLSGVNQLTGLGSFFK